jgi:hypothetical protein
MSVRWIQSLQNRVFEEEYLIRRELKNFHHPSSDSNVQSLDHQQHLKQD